MKHSTKAYVRELIANQLQFLAGQLSNDKVDQDKVTAELAMATDAIRDLDNEQKDAVSEARERVFSTVAKEAGVLRAGIRNSKHETLNHPFTKSVATILGSISGESGEDAVRRIRTNGEVREAMAADYERPTH